MINDVMPTKPKKKQPVKLDAAEELEPIEDTRSSALEFVANLDDGQEFDEDRQPANRKRRQTKKPRKKWSRKKKTIVFSILGIVLIIAAILGYFLWKGSDTINKVFGGNAVDLLKKEPLKKDAYGRSNILVFGTSEDDEGHSGADLTDSILVLSVNQDTKEASMLSIPRDLWVDYDQPCSVGFSGKINAVYSCAMQNNPDNEAASLAFAQKVGGILGIDIQYYLAVNYTVVRDLTDALGGIDVDVYADDPRGLYDVRMNLTLPQGVSHLNGEQALALSRARNAKGGYGLSRSNFDREKNQQRIIRAMQKKATSTGVLLNPSKVNGILNAIGDNMRTNVSAAEIRTVIDLSNGVNADAIVSLSLTEDGNSLVMTDNLDSQSIVRPVRGLTDYSDIQIYIQSSFQPTVQ